MTAARVFGFVADEANVCVLLRQGPPDQTLMVRWNLKTDKFVVGQWLKTRVAPGLCDLSPDGELFALHTVGAWPIRPDSVGPYLAVSRPPYFTALTFWHVTGDRRANVRWKGNRELWIDRPAEEVKSYARMNGQVSLHTIDGRILGLLMEERIAKRKARIELSGWDMRQVAYKSFAFDDTAFRTVWADVYHQGRLLLAREGRIYVRDAEGERELIDLNPLEFRPLAPGKASEWPD